MGNYINIHPAIASIKLGGKWKDYLQVRLKAAVHIANGKATLVLYGDGRRPNGKWERVPLQNIVLEDERGVQDLAALLLGFMAARRGYVWNEIVTLGAETWRKAARIASWLRRVEEKSRRW